MTSLPLSLLEQLLTELSTLASVYHKPPESFVGKGRFGADAIQRAAIQEQRRDAAENPIAAAVAAAANGAPPQSNVENLLDIDFDGAAPASAEASGTPDRVASPGVPAAPSGGMADMMGLFGDMGGGSSAPAPSAAAPSSGMDDIMGGFAGLDMGGSSAPPPATQQLQGGAGAGAKKNDNEDLLGLF